MHWRGRGPLPDYRENLKLNFVLFFFISFSVLADHSGLYGFNYNDRNFPCDNYWGAEKNAETVEANARELYDYALCQLHRGKISEGIAGLTLLGNLEDINSQYFLGIMYLEGKGVEQDSIEAFPWIHKAALQYHAPAQWTLGDMYEEGEGVEKNIDKAFFWKKKAVAQIHPNLGKIYPLFYYGIYEVEKGISFLSQSLVENTQDLSE